MRLQPLTDDDFDKLNSLLGAAPDFDRGEILKFEDAVLARAEVNKNGDGIDVTGLYELSASLPLMPLDDEHIPDRVIGFFTRAEVNDAERALLTDGIIYARRFPEVVKDIKAGRKHLSVEAYGELARCSVCNQVFSSPRDYCEHLLGRPGNGAVRWLSGLRAIGGGVVRNNAGTETTFDRNKFVMLASLAVPEVSGVPGVPGVPGQESGDNTESLDDVLDAPDSDRGIQKQEEERMIEELQRLLEETRALLRQREQQLEEACRREEELRASHADEINRLRLAFERKQAMLQAGFAPEEVSAIGDKLPAIDGDVFDLLLRQRAANKVSAAQQKPEATHKIMAGQAVASFANPFDVFNRRG